MGLDRGCRVAARLSAGRRRDGPSPPLRGPVLHPLEYAGQSGALNEHWADVSGTMVKQRTLGQDVTQADWLIGAELLAPGVHGVALRSMKAPSTAYDDPRLGRDPQPGHMSGYVRTLDDDGGVHINSGIPNKAFREVASALGGHVWQRAGASGTRRCATPRCARRPPSPSSPG